MKTPPPNHPISTLPAIESVPLYEVIAHRAKELWVRHGRPENRDEPIWVEAAQFIFVLAPVLR